MLPQRPWMLRRTGSSFSLGRLVVRVASTTTTSSSRLLFVLGWRGRNTPTVRSAKSWIVTSHDVNADFGFFSVH